MAGLAVRHEPASAAVVRRRITDVLKAASVTTDSIEDVVLVASELVNNAVVHTAGSADEALDVEWFLENAAVTVRITDGSPALPRQRSTDDADTGGRGLAIVGAMSTDWGVERTATGKQVWARVPVTRTNGCSAASARQSAQHA